MLRGLAMFKNDPAINIFFQHAIRSKSGNLVLTPRQIASIHETPRGSALKAMHETPGLLKNSRNHRNHKGEAGLTVFGYHAFVFIGVLGDPLTCRLRKEIILNNWGMIRDSSEDERETGS